MGGYLTPGKVSGGYCYVEVRSSGVLGVATAYLRESGFEFQMNGGGDCFFLTASNQAEVDRICGAIGERCARLGYRSMKNRKRKYH